MLWRDSGRCLRFSIDSQYSRYAFWTAAEFTPASLAALFTASIWLDATVITSFKVRYLELQIGRDRETLQISWWILISWSFSIPGAPKLRLSESNFGHVLGRTYNRKNTFVSTPRAPHGIRTHTSRNTFTFLALFLWANDAWFTSPVKEPIFQ